MSERTRRVIAGAVLVLTGFAVGVIYTDWTWYSGRAGQPAYTHALQMQYWREDMPK